MLDLDGVVYVGGDAVPGAPGHLDDARAAGMRLAFITNNAARPPAVVAAHLRDLGVQAAPSDVVTSAQAAARMLAERLPRGSAVVLLGSEGLREALAEEGLRPVGVEEAAADDAGALATGYGPDVLWRHVMRAAVAVRDGLWWVASNRDLTIPTPYGLAPGHGVLVETLERFSGARAEVAGKPERPLLDETVRRTGARRPLMVGDRLDTDIEGAHRAGVPSLLVMTGVTGLAELVAARPQERPSYLSADLGGLLVPHPEPAVTAPGPEAQVSCGGWSARCDDGRLVVTGDGREDDWWRVAAVSAWQHLDATGRVPDITGVAPVASGT